MISLANGQTRGVLLCACHARGLNCASQSKYTYGALHRVRSPPDGCVRRPNKNGLFFPFKQSSISFFFFLGHALGLDQHAALLIFHENLLNHAKTEGFFLQRELRKTDTAHKVCVGMAAQIAVPNLLSQYNNSS